MIDPLQQRTSTLLRSAPILLGMLALSAVLISAFMLDTSLAIAQTQPSLRSETAANVSILQGSVADSSGKLISDAIVRLVQAGASNTAEAKTNAAGIFVFSAPPTGSYLLSAEKAGLRSRTVAVTVKPEGDQAKVDLVLEDSKSAQEAAKTDANPSSGSTLQAMEFADKPNFTVAGVTDWTAVGGHGSDAILRTSETLARETITLKPDASAGNAPPSSAGHPDESEKKLRAALADAPSSLKANLQLGEFYSHAGRYPEAIPLLQSSYRIDPANREVELNLAIALKEAGNFTQACEYIQKLLAQQPTADLHRLAGELDEKLNDPLSAVHQFEQAVQMDSSEQNYFDWGSELLLHRAVWQAQEVFAKGAEAYPKSARMLAALGAALFAGARYDEAATRLCAASDLNPADPEPYLLMGKVEMAAPSPLACLEQRLSRFHQLQPENSLANYFYAMAIWKRQLQPPDSKDTEQVEALLMKAVTLDSKCADGYLQLGILASSRKDLEHAIGFYSKAIDANPQLSEAHYRLGVAYDRLGESAKATQQFQLHDEIEKSQAAAIEAQRREVKQFLVVLNGQLNNHPTP
jgi:tetratricopeptide (TPR) repeat protein